MDEVKLALIPPVQLLNYTQMTSYQLVLPHMVKEVDAYRFWYTRMAKSRDNYIILDNGEAEGFNYFSPDHLYGMAAHLGFDEIVVKDSMADMQGTKDLTKQFFDTISQERKTQENGPKFGFVLQGKSMQELMDITRWYLEEYGELVHTLYIPRHLISTLSDIHARIKVAKELDRLFKVKGKYDIHLLGAHHHAPVEVVIAEQQVPWVRGMDTSMPFNYGWNKALVGSGHFRRPDDYFDLLFDDEQKKYVDANVRQFINWAYGGFPQTHRGGMDD